MLPTDFSRSKKKKKRIQLWYQNQTKPPPSPKKERKKEVTEANIHDEYRWKNSPQNTNKPNLTVH